MVPVGSGNEAFLSELNRFLGGHQIVSVREELVQNGGDSVWSFCVKYVEGQAPSAAGSFEGSSNKEFLKNLPADVFRRFERMREIRKAIADEEKTRPYNVFVDVELVEMAKLENLTREAMLKIRGIGSKKADKYAERFIEGLKTLGSEEQQPLPETKEAPAYKEQKDEKSEGADA